MLVSKFPIGAKIITGQVSTLASSAVANTPGSIILTWTNPVGYKYFKGVVVRYKAGSYPVSETDGSLAYSGVERTAIVTGLTANTAYYFRAFAYAQNNSGTKTVYTTTIAGAQATALTYANPITALVIAKVSSVSLSCSWVAPANTYSQVMVKYKAGSYPTSPTDGTQAYLGTGTSVTVTGLTANTVYYFRVFVTNADGAYNTNTSQQGSSITKIAAGQAVFTSSQSYTIPAGVGLIDIFCVGGGGGSLTSGGGGGYTKTYKNIAVTPGEVAPVVVGAGGLGSGRISSGSTAQVGGTTSIMVNGAAYTATGGLGGADYLSAPGANGGSGGGGREGRDGYTIRGGNGGADGAGGGGGEYYSGAWYSDAGVQGSYGGSGQGTTTRAFGEVGNTLYAGGGGGSADSYDKTAGAVIGGAGGAGGGGNGASRYYVSYQNYGVVYAGYGGANTGGGAGGDYNVSPFGGFAGANGGSGICIIRWAEQ